MKVAAPALLAAALLAASTVAVERAAPSTAEDCARYREAASAAPSGSVRAAGIRLGLARCLRETGSTEGAATEYTTVAAGPLGDSPALLDEASSFLAASSIPLAGHFDRALEVPLPRDRQGREALARVLLVLAREPDTPAAARAVERLWIELPDAPAARALLATPAGRERAARGTRDEAVRRARALLDAPDPPAALAALEPFLPGEADTAPAACEARVLQARALRRVGRSSEALAAARVAAKRCEGGPAAEALYLVVTLLTGREEDPAAEVEELLRRFPEDSRCDDVLLQRAQLLARGADPSRCRPVLERILERYPRGDMAHDARFLLALERARAGSVPAARRLLGDATRLAPPGDAADRAAYWSARLLLAPALGRLAPTRDAKARAAAIADLTRLARTRFGSYYAVLARLLVHDATGTAIPFPEGRVPRARLPANAAVPTPPRLLADEAFRDAVALAGSGFPAEARLVLDLVVARLGALTDAERLQLAQAYRATGDAARAYRTVSPAEGRSVFVAPGPGEPDAPAAWTLLYPDLFRQELDGAAARAGVPSELLRALAREESTFDPAAVSPTGAVGLCQIQAPGAQEAAATLRRAVPTPAELLDPALNAAIGATYLRARLDGFRHPLLALAAYNRGPASIGALARRLGAVPIDTFVERIPARETREYVKRVAGSWDAYAALDSEARGASFPTIVAGPGSKPSP